MYSRLFRGDRSVVQIHASHPQLLLAYTTVKNQAGVPRDWRLCKQMVESMAKKHFVIEGGCPTGQDAYAPIPFLDSKQSFDARTLLLDGRILQIDFTTVLIVIQASILQLDDHVQGISHKPKMWALTFLEGLVAMPLL